MDEGEIDIPSNKEDVLNIPKRNSGGAKLYRRCEDEVQCVVAGTSTRKVGRLCNGCYRSSKS